MIKPSRVRQAAYCALWEKEKLLLKLIKMNLIEPCIAWGRDDCMSRIRNGSNGRLL
jgi:hypothetical protein